MLDLVVRKVIGGLQKVNRTRTLFLIGYLFYNITLSKIRNNKFVHIQSHAMVYNMLNSNKNMH